MLAATDQWPRPSRLARRGHDADLPDGRDRRRVRPASGQLVLTQTATFAVDASGRAVVPGGDACDPNPIEPSAWDEMMDATRRRRRPQ